MNNENMLPLEFPDEQKSPGDLLRHDIRKRREAPGIFYRETARETQGPGVPED